MIVKKFIKVTRDTWIIFGIALLIFVAIEAGFSLAFYARGIWHTPYVDFRIMADAYADNSWVPQYFREHDQLGNPRWRSYSYWRRPPYSGNHININHDGIRKTSNPIAPEGTEPAAKVFMFGGSTMFGSGERDDFTIPSIFAKEARNRNINCEVVNFGQEAYVSTQEVIELMLQLQKGNIPDLVIFYDGANDTHTASQMHAAGLPFNEFKREKEFNLSEKRELIPLAFQSAVNGLSTIRFFNGLLKGFEIRRDSARFDHPLEYEKPISDKAALALAVVETYLNNIQLAHALSKFYGFECLFYWQPIIDQKQPLTEYERKVLEFDPNHTSIKDLYGETYAFLQSRSAGLKGKINLHDLGQIFNGVREPIFIDYVHLGERGNTLVARKIVEDVAQLLELKRTVNL
ncbi:MAG TPA: hypothetical protein VJ810_18115 [Blastocatellia bacterium]|nr:hypothetical protein [Blastocatellia bacterium]